MIRLHSVVVCCLSVLAVVAQACLEPEPRHDEVEPPPGFDVEACADIRGPGSPDAGAFAALHCSDCCFDKGLQDSSFILDDACVCADLPPIDSDPFICRDSAWEDDCLSCCDTAGFAYADSVEGECVCLGQDDPDSCDDVFQYKDPEAACAVCCVEAGYLGIEFYLDRASSVCSCTR